MQILGYSKNCKKLIQPSKLQIVTIIFREYFRKICFYLQAK